MQTIYMVAGPPCDDLIHQAEAGPRPAAPLVSYELGFPTARRGHASIDSALWDLVARGAALLRAVYPKPVPLPVTGGEPPPFEAPLLRRVYPEPGSWAARLRQGTQTWIQGREALRLYLSDDGLRVAADNGDAVPIAEILADLPADEDPEEEADNTPRIVVGFDGEISVDARLLRRGDDSPRVRRLSFSGAVLAALVAPLAAVARRWTTYGSVRGFGPLRSTREEVVRDLAEDREGCAAQGGYSDRRLYEVDGEGYLVGGWRGKHPRHPDH